IREVVARPDRPRRCTLPITALRVTPPSRPAIWLALNPSDHNFFNNSTRSSFQAIPSSPALAIAAGSPQNARNPAIPSRAGQAFELTSSRQREPDRPTNNATGNCEGLVLWTRRHQQGAPLRVRALGYSPHRINARYAVDQRHEITTRLMCASSGGKARLGN